MKVIAKAKDKDEAIPTANLGATIENIWDIASKNRGASSAGRVRFEPSGPSNFKYNILIFVEILNLNLSIF